MYNVVWSPLDNIVQGFYLRNVVARVLREHWTRFFPCNVVWSLLDNMAQVFFSYFVQCCPKKIKTTLKTIFSCAMLSVAQGHYVGFFLWNIAPKVLRQHCTGFFPVQYYLQPMLRKVFTCAMLSQTFYGNIEQDFSHATLSGKYCTRFLPVQYCPKSIKTRLNKIFYEHCCLEALGQHYTRHLPVQCCPKRIKTTLDRIFSCAMLFEFFKDNIA